MPYAHKYANAVTELGYFGALKKFIPTGAWSTPSCADSKAVLGKDIESVMTMLVDAEMKMFDGLETPVIFLQNVVTDLILGLGAYDVFASFANYVKRRYKAEAGFFTMNLPKLLRCIALGRRREPDRLRQRQQGRIPDERRDRRLSRRGGPISGARDRHVGVRLGRNFAAGGHRMGDERALRRIDRVRRFEPREHREHGRADPRV